jgi:(p)ppGpp synthase/HD superfamily hydrolase
LRAVEVAQQARAFAAEAYGSEEELEHPAEVAALVRDASGDSELAAAGFLHDLVEDTDVELPRVASAFGSRIAALVAAMTEDESIPDYAQRKEEHRCRARDSGRDAAVLFVADKLSNARRMRRGQKEPDPRKLAHYAQTLATVRAAYPDLPLLDELEAELNDARGEGLPVSAPGRRLDERA